MNNGHSSGSSSGTDLKRQQSLSISPEVFERLYLSPQNAVKGDLRKTFGNPTPLALVGFTVALSSIDFGVNYFFGGMLLVISGLLEFFLGNTFPSAVFFSYGAHFITFAATFQLVYNAVGAYDPSGGQTQTPAFAASFAFYALFRGLLPLIFFVCSLRTNVVFALIFTAATLEFALAAAAFWTTAQGMDVGATLLVSTGDRFFAAAIFGWYLLAVIMFAELDLPLAAMMPVFDLSTVIKGRSARLS